MKKGSIATYRKWRELLLNHLGDQEREIIAKIEALVPASLKRFLSEEFQLVPNVFQYGQASRKYRREEGSAYGYTDLDDLISRLQELRAAWDGIIEVDIRLGELPHQVKVFYTAVPAPASSTDEMNLATLDVTVVFAFNNQVLLGKLDREESFMAVIAQAVRNGKDPIEALAFLAEEGDRRGERSAIGWLNRIGE